jgi:hypothetical protein
MFKRLFTRTKARRSDIERYVEMEYRLAERPAVLIRLLREAGLK